MTTKPIASPSSSPATTGMFPGFPSRDDMQNSLHLYDPGHMSAIRRHLGNPDTTVVIGEVPIGWNIHTRREIIRVPDLLIALNVDRALVVAEMGYSIDEHGKAPDFALEIASPNTARNDETGKRQDYARFGVLEYWRYDSQGGEWYSQALAGDRLVDGQYQPIEIHWVDAERCWGHSEVLNLDICWEYGEMRWYDPVAGVYLPTFDEADDGRLAERSARLAERSARLEAEERVRQLEAEVNRLRNA